MSLSTHLLATLKALENVENSSKIEANSYIGHLEL